MIRVPASNCRDATVEGQVRDGIGTRRSGLMYPRTMAGFARSATIVVAGIGLLAGLAGCGQRSHEFRLVTPPLDFDRDVAAELVEVFEQNSPHSITLVPLPASAQSPLDALEAGHADLALASNIQPYRRGVTTVMPLYPTVLHVLYKRDREFDDLRSLLDGATVYAGPVDSSSRQLMLTVLQSLELSEDDIVLMEKPDMLPDVIGLYLPASPGRIAERLGEAGAVGQYQLMSLGTLEDIGAGSSLDRALPSPCDRRLSLARPS